MASHRLSSDENCDGDDRNKEVLQWIFDQGGRGTRVLDIAMAGVKVVAVDVAMEDDQSAAKEIADEENK